MTSTTTSPLLLFSGPRFDFQLLNHLHYNFSLHSEPVVWHATLFDTCFFCLLLCTVHIHTPSASLLLSRSTSIQASLSQYPCLLMISLFLYIHYLLFTFASWGPHDRVYYRQHQSSFRIPSFLELCGAGILGTLSPLSSFLFAYRYS
jgi:hypothetical protein